MTAPGATDRYPTRLARRQAPVARRDPVVYGSGSGPLAADRCAGFASQGFVVVDRLVDDDAVQALLAEVERLAADPALADDERVVREPGGDDVRSVFEVHRRSPLIAELVGSPTVAGIARQLLGSEVYVHQSRANRKPGFVGREFAWHSDFETWHAEDGMPGARAVSLSLALTPNFVHNGSLMIIPGSHRTFVPTVGETPDDHYRASLRRQEVGVPDRDSLRALVEEAGDIAVVTGGAGSAVFFDCNAMHGSSANITPFPRTNLFVVYNSVENALREPFAASSRRPEFVASRDFTPVG